jgi:hypothetical protein
MMIQLRQVLPCVAAVALLVACGSPGGTAQDPYGVSYTIAEGAIGGKTLDWTKSCRSPDGIIDPATVSALSWAPGAEPRVTVSFDRPCGFLSSCPPFASEAIVPTHPDVWALTPEGSAEDVVLRALGPGSGGLQASANGVTFPPLTLQAVAVAGIELHDAADADLPNGLSMTAGGGATILVAPLDAGGVRLCGFPPIQVAVSAGLSAQPSPELPGGGVGQALRANLPFVVHAGDSSGPESVTVGVGGVVRTLNVEVDRP